MKVLYLDLINGISGDMFLGAMLDLGLNFAALEAALGTMSLTGYEFQITPISIKKIAAIDFEVVVHDASNQPARHLPDILKLIENSSLSASVKEKAASVFQLLAEAEAKIHSTTPQKIHFHEVGAIDSIVDIVGVIVAVESLGIEKIYASIPSLGCGEVECQHGIIPVPAPATLEILTGMEVEFTAEVGEKITPTGAALLKTLVTEFGVLPKGKVLSVGYGAGKRKGTVRPNMLRGVLLESTRPEPKLLVVETNLDDSNPELLSHVAEKLLSQGALDVYLTQLQMKKGRPGLKFSALIEEGDLEETSAVILKETSSFGLRYYPVARRTLQRQMGLVETRWGQLRVKVGYWEGEILKVMPEFDSARELSEKNNVPLIDIYAEANRAADTLKLEGTPQ